MYAYMLEKSVLNLWAGLVSVEHVHRGGVVHAVVERACPNQKKRVRLERGYTHKHT